MRHISQWTIRFAVFLYLSLVLSTFTFAEENIPYTVSGEPVTENTKALAKGPASALPPTHDEIAPGSCVTADLEPSSFVNGSVNVIYGTYFDSSEDLQITLPEPLSYVRYQNSLATYREKGADCWFTNHPYKMPLVLNPTMKFELYAPISIMEPGGSLLQYYCSYSKKMFWFFLHPEIIQNGLTNTGSKEISARTNLKNHVIKFTKKSEKRWWSGTYELSMGSGGKRIYGTDGVLLEETKPSGNKILYAYTPEEKVTLIQATNRDQSKIFGSLQFRYLPCDHMEIEASNGTKVFYEIDRKGDQIRVLPSHGPKTVYYYLKFKDAKRLWKVEKPDSRYLITEYDRKGRVFFQRAPLGIDANPIEQYRFEYAPKERATSVFDAYGNRKIYRYSPESRLTAIEDITKSGGKYRASQFFWGGNVKSKLARYDASEQGNLISKAISNANGEIKECHSYYYDSRGNVLTEVLFGNLSGTCDPVIVLGRDQRPISNGVENYHKSYSYSNDGFNLKLSETDGFGKKIVYAYQPGTDLLTATLIYDGDAIRKREFREYDHNGVITAIFVDDGCRMHVQDLTGVTKRIVTLIRPQDKEGLPGFGQPEQITEGYLDLSSQSIVPLKRRHFSYCQGDLLEKEEVYDANDTLRYTLHYTYDEKFRLIKQTTPIGQEITYTYDANGNKLSERQSDLDFTVLYTYDYSNRLIKKEERHDNGKVFSQSFRYDFLSNKISEIEPYMSMTRFSDLSKPYPQVFCHPMGAKYAQFLIKSTISLIM